MILPFGKWKRLGDEARGAFKFKKLQPFTLQTRVAKIIVADDDK